MDLNTKKEINQKTGSETNRLQVEAELLRQQLNELDAYIKSLDDKLLELHNMVNALNYALTIKTPVDALIPLVSGVFANGMINDLQRLNVNVGAGVVVEKPLNEAIKLLELQISDLSHHREDIVREFEKGVRLLQEKEKQF